MSPEGLAIGYVAGTVILGLAGCGLLFSAIRALTRVSGSTARAIERREKELNAMVLRMVEKQTCESVKVAEIHANERLHQAREDAKLERAMKPESPRRQPVEEMMTVGAPEDQAYGE